VFVCFAIFVTVVVKTDSADDQAAATACQRFVYGFETRGHPLVQRVSNDLLQNFPYER